MREGYYLLAGKDDKAGYGFLQELLAASAESDEYYKDFDWFSSLLGDKKSYVRTRGFLLCCAQAPWDKEGKIASAWTKMEVLLHDEKPTVVRQCLKGLRTVAAHRPELYGTIRDALDSMNLFGYKDSMAPLIEKDRATLRELLDASGSVVM